MSIAARAARFAVVASLVAAATFSISGLTGPQEAFAAGLESAQSQNLSAQQATTRLSERQKIVSIAKSHLGANYRFGAEGMKNFDCSGLVWRVFEEAGLEAKIGSARKGARAYYRWFKRQGLASRTDPKPGDLVIWHKGKHIGIYIGNGEIISALNKKYGVRIHGLDFVSGFTAYLHVQLSDKVPPSDGGNGTTLPSTVKVVVDLLNVRNGPGMGHSAIALIARGKTITVTNKARDKDGRAWFEGKLASGKVGWVPAWHVRAV
ncbi:MAG: NlpC/P60 family protein [Chloroflexota bacterium]